MFTAVVGGHAHDMSRGRVSIRAGLLRIPDARLARLAGLLGSERVTATELTLWHYPNDALQAGGATESEWVGDLRRADLLLCVVQAGGEPGSGEAVDAQLADISSELALYDLAVLEGSIARTRERLARGPRAERRDVQTLLDALRQVRSDLEQGLHAEAGGPEYVRETLRGFALLSSKPRAVAVNAADDAVRATQSGIDAKGSRDWCVVAGDTESQLHDLDAREAEWFRKDLGLNSPAAARVASALLGAADLITFYTGNENATAAWLLPRGASAVQAAAAVHSDMAERFIRADVMEADRLIEAGSLAAARGSGALRREGRDYTVADGDFVLVHFSR